MTRPRRIAVIGSGVAGLTAAHVAARSAHVTLYEADARLGGHADTHDVGRASPSTPASSCTTSAPTRRCCDSSPSSASRRSRPRCRCRCATSRPAWSTPARSVCAGCSRPDATCAAPGSCGCSPRSRASTVRLARCSNAPAEPTTTRRCATSSPRAASRRTSAGTSWSRSSRRCGRATRRSRSTTPRATCSSSSPTTGCSRSPARRSGARSSAAPASTSPAWPPASTTYASAPRSPPCARRPTASRSPTATAPPTTYDAVVIATHPDQALAMLAGADRRPARRARARCRTPTTSRCSTPTPRCSRRPRRPGRRGTSCARAGDRGSVTVTYDLTRLQRLPTQTHYLVTLGGEDLVDPRTVIARMEYAHPIYNPESVAAQRRLPEADTGTARLRRRLPRLGLPRGRRALRCRRGRAPRPDAGTTRRRRSPGCTTRTIRHTRRRPFRRQFAHRSQSGWSTSTPCPTTACSAASRPATTSAHPRRRSAPTSTGSSPSTASTSTAARVLMAANARAFGNGFNPISVFWCFDRDGRSRGHDRRGAQHLRRPARLPRPPRRARPGPRRQGALRLAVPRHRRVVRRRWCPCRATTSGSRSPSTPRTARRSPRR